MQILHAKLHIYCTEQVPQQAVHQLARAVSGARLRERRVSARRPDHRRDPEEQHSDQRVADGGESTGSLRGQRIQRYALRIGPLAAVQRGRGKPSTSLEEWNKQVRRPGFWDSKCSLGLLGPLDGVQRSRIRRARSQLVLLELCVPHADVRVPVLPAAGRHFRETSSDRSLRPPDVWLQHFPTRTAVENLPDCKGGQCRRQQVGHDPY